MAEVNIFFSFSYLFITFNKLTTRRHNLLKCQRIYAYVCPVQQLIMIFRSVGCHPVTSIVVFRYYKTIILISRLLNKYGDVGRSIECY